jgi:hypothetical protein
MNRRDFLNRVVQMSLAAMAAVMLPQLRSSARGASPIDIRTSAGGKELLGTLDGRIFESLDSGKTWQPRANFGKQCSIMDIYERSGKLCAHVGVGRYSFVAESRDVRTWHTQNWVPRKV